VQVGKICSVQNSTFVILKTEYSNKTKGNFVHIIDFQQARQSQSHTGDEKAGPFHAG